MNKDKQVPDSIEILKILALTNFNSQKKVFFSLDIIAEFLTFSYLLIT